MKLILTINDGVDPARIGRALQAQMPVTIAKIEVATDDLKQISPCTEQSEKVKKAIRGKGK